MEWIDLAIKSTEAELSSAIAGLGARERKKLTASLLKLIGMPAEDLDISVLRLLVERSRGMALPAALWSRPLTSSSSIQSESDRHLKRLGIASTKERLADMKQLYLSFAEGERDQKLRVTLEGLQAQNFRCGRCGLAFCNDQLERYAFSSPYGDRKKPKGDPLKPHWNPERKSYLEPTVDHIWSIKVFGDNRPRNLMIQCRGCNEGKAHYLATENVPAWTGLSFRPQLEKGIVDPLLFFSQLRRHPACEDTGKTAADAELTVQLRDPTLPVILDNLRTVESPGI